MDKYFDAIVAGKSGVDHESDAGYPVEGMVEVPKHHDCVEKITR